MATAKKKTAKKRPGRKFKDPLPEVAPEAAPDLPQEGEPEALPETPPEVVEEAPPPPEAAPQGEPPCAKVEPRKMSVKSDVYLRVSTENAKGFCRCGRRFTREAVEIPTEELTEQELDRLIGEPHLVTELVTREE